MYCRTCGEVLRVCELKRGTCEDCETAINKMVEDVRKGKRKASEWPVRRGA